MSHKRVDVKLTVRHCVLMARDEPLLRIRVPEELKASLSEAASSSGRSVNAEIRMRLEWSFEGGFDGQPSDKMLMNEVESMKIEVRSAVHNLTEKVNELQARLDALESRGVTD